MKLAKRLMMRQSGGGDPYWQNVALLVQPPLDAVDGSTVIQDGSPDARTVSRFGNTHVDTSLGFPTVLLDGSGDYLTVPHATAFNMLSPCTLECLFRPTSLSRDFQTLLAKRANTSAEVAAGWALAVRGVPAAKPSTLDFIGWYNGSVVARIITPINSLAVGTDYHAEVTRDNAGVYRLYLNGLYIGQSAGGVPIGTTEALHIGRYSTTISEFNPQYDGVGHVRVRWTDGVARHADSASFAPPTKFTVG